MATLKTNLIEPSTGTTLTVGESGGDFVIGADSIKNNVLKDAGGNAIFTSNGSGVVSGVNSGFGSAMVLLSTQTASSSANVSFTSGIDATYTRYAFEYINIHPATDDANLQVEFSSDGGSSYGITKTTTYFYCYNRETSGSYSLSYQTSRDLAQSTSPQQIASLIGNDADAASSGEFHLFAPSSTTYQKNFYGTSNTYETSTPYSIRSFVGGYVNSTAVVNAVKFSMSSGNMDYGIIKMYGIK